MYVWIANFYYTAVFVDTHTQCVCVCELDYVECLQKI